MFQVPRQWMLLLLAVGICSTAKVHPARSDPSSPPNVTATYNSILANNTVHSTISAANLSRSASHSQVTTAPDSNLVSSMLSSQTKFAAGTTISGFEIINDTFWATLVTEPPPTSTSQSHIWTVPIFTGSIDNSSLTACYASWQTYFQRLSSASTSYSTSEYVSTVTSTVNPGVTGYVEGTTTQTWISTIEVVNGGFTLSSELSTSIFTQTGLLLRYGAPFPTTFTQLETASSPVIIHPPPQPTCALPSVVPQCQSSWFSYLDTWYPTPYFVTNQPQCRFASMNPSACWSLRDKYVTHWNDLGTNYPNLSNGYTNIEVTQYYGNYVTEFAWPKYTSLAPGCSLGCARCAMTGGTIQLLYWPATSTYDTSNGPVTAVVGESTLTYPTVYVSYREIFASDSCGPVGPSITNTIVAIPTPSEISSIYGTITEYAPAFEIIPPALKTTAFNISDLNPPIPYSIYEKQPWCQSLLNAWTFSHFAYGPNPSTTTCPTTEPYKPILYLPSAILNSIDALWAACSGDVHGVYDPPSALQPAASLPVPTFPAPWTATFATPFTSTSLAPTPAATPASAPSPTTLPFQGPFDPFPAMPDQQSTVIPPDPSLPSQPSDLSPPPPFSDPSLSSLPSVAPVLPPAQISPPHHSPVSSLSYPVNPTLPILTITTKDGTVYLADPDSPPNPLLPGQQTTLEGHTISAPDSGSAIIVIDGSSTLQLPISGLDATTGDSSPAPSTPADGPNLSAAQTDGGVIVVVAGAGSTASVTLEGGQETVTVGDAGGGGGRTVSGGAEGGIVATTTATATMARTTEASDGGRGKGDVVSGRAEYGRQSGEGLRWILGAWFGLGGMVGLGWGLA